MATERLSNSDREHDVVVVLAFQGSVSRSEIKVAFFPGFIKYRPGNIALQYLEKWLRTKGVDANCEEIRISGVLFSRSKPLG